MSPGTQVDQRSGDSRPAAGELSATTRAHTRQLTVAIVAPVRPRRLAQLRRLLETMGEDPSGNAIMPFGSLQRVHFARLVLLERARDLDGNAIPAQLLYMCDIDEPLADHLDELLDLTPGLDRVFGACEGYPTRTTATRGARACWLADHLTETQAYYVNTVGLTVAQILRDAELRDRLEAFLDRHDWDGRDPLEVRTAIQDHVRTSPELAWALAPSEGRSLLDRARDVAAVALPLAGAAASAPVWLPLAPAYLLALRLHELTDTVETERPTAAHERRLAELEDRHPQNQFSAVGFVKPGLLRRATIALGIRGLDVAARHVFNNGSLAGVETIHFAHWTMLDSGRRLIFTSNYDGTVKSYNDDFIDRLWWGLNLVFSNGVGWPQTFLALWGGCRNEQEFKYYLRRHQIPTQVWFSAYPTLTALNIADNAKLRAGLAGSIGSEEARRWLRLF
jgi:hypothetical protein